jgi:hypothetical protein
MKTISVTLDDDVYQRAEHKAEALQTSVSQVAAEYVSRWAAEDDLLTEARSQMTARFAQPDWQFAVGSADNRAQRNTRG